MKLERQQFGIKIFLTDEEAKAMMNLCFSHQSEAELAMAIYSELEEYFGENNE